MIMSIYPEVVQTVLDVCQLYIDNGCDVKKLHQTSHWAEICVTSLEEKELREFFMIIENEIDYIRVMSNETDFEYRGLVEIEDRESILKIVNKIIEKLS